MSIKIKTPITERKALYAVYECTDSETMDIVVAGVIDNTGKEMDPDLKDGSVASFRTIAMAFLRKNVDKGLSTRVYSLKTGSQVFYKLP